MSELLMIISLALLGSVFALVGGVLFLTMDKWRKVLTFYSVPFAAGVMLTIAFLGLLPEAVHVAGESVFTIVLLTIIGTHLFERMVFSLHHHDHDHDDHHSNSATVTNGSATLVVIGDTIHNFIDGVAIAVAYIVNPGLGLITALSTFLHEVPHEIGDFGVLLKAGFSKRKVFLVNIFSALSTVFGAVLIYFLPVGDSFIGILLAVAAGMFIYLGASDFLPQVGRKSGKFGPLVALILGVGTMYAVFSLIPHSHEEEGVHEEHIEENILSEDWIGHVD